MVGRPRAIKGRWRAMEGFYLPQFSRPSSKELRIIINEKVINRYLMVLFRGDLLRVANTIGIVNQVERATCVM